MASRTTDHLALRTLFTGGEAVPEKRARAFEEKTGAFVLQFYGSNETGAVSVTRPEDPAKKRLTTAGKPTPQRCSSGSSTPRVTT